MILKGKPYRLTRRKLRILRDWLDLGIRDYEPTSDRYDECENEEGR